MGYPVVKQTLYNHIKAGLLGCEQAASGRVTKILHSALVKYAHAHLVKKDTAAATLEIADDRQRLLKAQADKLEWDVKIKSGMYLLASEEESRDARILAGIKQGVENFGPFIIQQMLTLAAGMIGSDCQQKLSRMTPELLAYYSDQAQDLFDRYAKAGAV